MQISEMTMSDFNAHADVYCLQVQPSGTYRPIQLPRPVHSGTIADCVNWVMAKRDYRETYFMTVPLEAGFIKDELRYPDIQQIAARLDFPR
jgi:hypothetical protein